ncbi:DEAD/DEAH box helicase, putative [Entamoeba nuttalli P19]|uniref:DEAD/DEAH box helicase, putative n=2 Tax=Entamoeba nuttalli TaxID=412467 RepID=K2HWQ5_ENTNP|nr:DEAD/DEAH box helicase, putative [Entamoeba nuttalli P19]EKE40660.1 DEAD/DEAH box helicase, putative [Entamoeba nuttalli P19]|eukprot:XP_008857005.1 DEAD/DEAH box helicase, putative [Entamoeba nuttalli P19]
MKKELKKKKTLFMSEEYQKMEEIKEEESIKEENEEEESLKEEKKKMEEEEIDDNLLMIEMKKWMKLYKLDLRIIRALYDLGFINPTEIQQLSIKKALKFHKDIVGSAPTGSGKTLSFLIPIVQRLIELDKTDSTQCVIIVPTRELAVQINEHFKKLIKYLPQFTSLVIVGGMAIPKQVRLLSQEPTIVIGTPGRLYELYSETEHNVLQTLPEIPFIVLDEADRLLEKGHFVDFTKLLDIFNNKEKQTFVFSATMILASEMMAKKYSSNGEDELTRMLQKLKLNDAELIDVSTPQQTVEQMEEKKVVVPSLVRDEALFYILTYMKPGKTLVFVNAITMIKRLVPLFQMIGCSVCSLYSGMEMSQRLRNIEKFTKGNDIALFTTDVSARGIDIDDVKTVIHYDLPRTSELYVHRSGRTARAGRSGLCIVFVEKEDKTPYEHLLKTLKKKDFPMIKLDAKPYNFAKKILSLARKISNTNQQHKKISNDKALKKALDIDDQSSDEETEDERVERQRNEKLEKMKIFELKEELKDLLKRYQITKYHGTNKADFLIGLQLKEIHDTPNKPKGKSKRDQKRQHFVSPKNLEVGDIEEQLRFVRSLKK